MEEIGTLDTNDRKAFIFVNHKLKIWKKFIRFFILMVCSAFTVALIQPIYSKSLFVNIAFPFESEISAISFWIESLVLAGGMFLSLVCCLFTVIIWYLMLSIVFKYNMLGHQFKNMGVIKAMVNNGIESKRKLSLAKQQNIFLKDLIMAIEKLMIKSTGMTNKLKIQM